MLQLHLLWLLFICRQQYFMFCFFPRPLHFLSYTSIFIKNRGAAKLSPLQCQSSSQHWPWQPVISQSSCKYALKSAAGSLSGTGQDWRQTRPVPQPSSSSNLSFADGGFARSCWKIHELPWKTCHLEGSMLTSQSTFLSWRFHRRRVNAFLLKTLTFSLFWVSLGKFCGPQTELTAVQWRGKTCLTCEQREGKSKERKCTGIFVNLRSKNSI